MLAVCLTLMASLYFQGLLGRTRAIACGRKGPGIFQHLKDIWRLFRKETIYSRTASIIFKIGPSVYFASIIMALLVLPLDEEEAILSFNGDFIFFVYILGVGKFFLMLSALDIGSSFEGMGANREAFYNALLEPVFFILLGSFAMLSGHTSFTDIYSKIHDEHLGSVSYLLSILASYILVQIMMIENSRLPVDDPGTRLEVTMIHEAMVLDTSGFDLGIIKYGAALKFAIFGTLIANFFTSLSQIWVGKVLIFFGIQTALAIIAGLLESFQARSRMRRNPQGIITLTAICILIFFGALIIMDKFK